MGIPADEELRRGLEDAILKIIVKTTCGPPELRKRALNAERKNRASGWLYTDELRAMLADVRRYGQDSLQTTSWRPQTRP